MGLASRLDAPIDGAVDLADHPASIHATLPNHNTLKSSRDPISREQLRAETTSGGGTDEPSAPLSRAARDRSHVTGVLVMLIEAC